MPLTATEQALLNHIDTHAEAMVGFCQRLLQIPSVNGVHDEVHLARAIAAEAETLGLHNQIAGENPQRPNVLVSTATGQPTGLLLIGHMDTVPPGDKSRWTYPPFSGTLADGKLYGRGAVDTKGGMSAALYALAALAAVPGALPHKQAQFIGVPDEESGATGTLGIKWLHGQGLLRATGAIYAYSGDTIYIGHRGLLRYKLVAEGIAEHTGSPAWQDQTNGANAVTAMADLLLRLENTTLPPSQTPYFEAFRTIITPGTMISGGVSINIVPDHCEALVDIRTTPEHDRAQIETLIDAAIQAVSANRPGIRLHADNLNALPAVIADPAAAIFTILGAATHQLTGHAPALAVAGPANEGYLLIERGIPTVCGFGPRGENFHAIDEYVEIDSLAEAAKIYALTAHRMAL